MRYVQAGLRPKNESDTQTQEGQTMAMIARGAHAMQSRAAARQPKELYNDK
jgi:hypothetical protein